MPPHRRRSPVPRAGPAEIRLRVVLDAPAPGVVHSLQDEKNQPVDGRRSPDGSSLAFEFPVRLANGRRLSGRYVRRDGPERRFVYIAIGKQAGEVASCWDRRMKIDIHTIAQPLLDQALTGKVLEAVVAGTGEDGTPACATVSPIREWRAVPS